MRKAKVKSKKVKFIVSCFVLLVLCVAFKASGQIASGGIYALEKTVAAGGGAASTGGGFSVEGTIGQFAVGGNQQNSTFTVYAGFWTPAPLAPTASSVLLGGRVVTSDGRGIGNVRIALTLPGGEIRDTISNPFGYYQFTRVPVGETYILMAYSRRFTFQNVTQIVTLIDAREDVDFVAAVN